MNGFPIGIPLFNKQKTKNKRPTRLVRLVWDPAFLTMEKALREKVLFR